MLDEGIAEECGRTSRCIRLLTVRDFAEFLQKSPCSVCCLVTPAVELYVSQKMNDQKSFPIFHHLAMAPTIFAGYWVYYIISGNTIQNNDAGDMMGSLRPFVYATGCFFISAVFASIGFLRSERLNNFTMISSTFAIVGFILGLLSFVS